MSAYVYPNFKTKKSLKEAVKRGDSLIVKEQTPFGEQLIENGVAFLEGPHFPSPHSWYAKAFLKEGKIIKLS